jgi:hypothetical protein
MLQISSSGSDSVSANCVNSELSARDWDSQMYFSQHRRTCNWCDKNMSKYKMNSIVFWEYLTIINLTFMGYFL